MTDLAPDLDGDLDDYDSDALQDVPVADSGYLAAMWGSYSFRSREEGESESSSLAQDTAVAHGMVQSFVNAFARDGRYAVSFDENCSGAGTAMNARQVVITPAPVADRSISARQAGLILTGLAVHEICHPRYGRMTLQAVRKTFPGNQVADRLSNLLDDIRIERRFVADYPGYAGVFAPTLDYIGAAGVRREGGHRHVQRLSDPVNLAIAATRYPTFSDWTPATSLEAAWWTAWADRWSPEDAPRRHVEAVREALLHVADVRSATPSPKSGPAPSPARAGAAPDAQGATGTGADSADAGTDAGAGTGAQAAPEGMTDEDLNAVTSQADAGEAHPEASCSGSEAVDDAVASNGTDTWTVGQLKRTAQQIVEAARNVEDDGHGHGVDVAQSLKGLTHGGDRLGPSALASRYIRNAILRSRTGHAEVDPLQRHGRLDQKGLARIARGDARVFERRHAPSPGRYLVWVMVDCSGSMSGEIEYAAQVAHAMASATQGAASVRMAVWGWATPFRPSPARAGVAKVWETGQPVDRVFKMSGLHKGGTPDSVVLSWAARKITKAVSHDETPVIIFISDGDGNNDMDERVVEARKLGAVVKSVSFGHGFSAGDQEARFGRGNFIPYEGSIVETARPLGELFARITSGR